MLSMIEKWSNFVMIIFVLFFGSSGGFKVYSLLCSVDLVVHMGYWGSNPGKLHLGQVPYLLHNLSAPCYDFLKDI